MWYEYKVFGRVHIERRKKGDGVRQLAEKAWKLHGMGTEAMEEFMLKKIELDNCAPGRGWRYGQRGYGRVYVEKQKGENNLVEKACKASGMGMKSVEKFMFRKKNG